MNRFFSPAAGRRSRRSLLGILTTAALIALFVVPAQAVHNNGLFELGNATASPGSADILGSAQAGPDWADLFDADGNVVDLFGGVTAAFIADTLSAKGPKDDTTFAGAGGSNKNNDPVSNADCAAHVPPLTGSACDTWHWDAGNVPIKDDLSNVYAYAAFDDSFTPPHLIFYIGLERLDPSGDSHIDIEFFQDEVALDEAPLCNDPGADVTPCAFTGIRTVGDLIVSMDFVQGGGIGEVDVRSWNGTGYALAGVAAGEGCNGADTICAVNNAGTIDGGPWPNFGSGGASVTQLQGNAFTEVGVDVTDLIGGDPCITTVMGKTRSSQSFTAELKDFAGPASFPICGANIGIEADDVNEVGQEHTFTVTVNQELGAIETPIEGVFPAVTLTDANGSAVDPISDTCVDDGINTGTDANGQCTVTFTSDTPGTITGHAAVDVTVGGQTTHVETDGEGNNSDDAVKRFVDAFITINPPEDTNSIGETHTFTVNVQQDDGTGAGFVDVLDGTIVTVTLTGDADSVVDTCANPGTSGGECTVTFTSDTVGDVTGHASVDLTFDGLSVHRETDGTGQNSGNALKHFVAGSIAWLKVDNAENPQGGATFEVCPASGPCLVVVDDTDGVAGPGPDQDPDPGEFLVTGLALGTYTVEETVAPPGFEPDPDVVEVTLTEANPDVTISEAFVNQRPILKISGFGYTNVATGSPTSGVVSGTATYTVDLHNYGGAAAVLSNSSLDVDVTGAGAGTLDCTPLVPASITGTVAADGDLDPSFTVACDYDNMDDGAVITATLIVNYTTNGVDREASGSPATISFTVQAD